MGKKIHTGKSLLEALILAATNPQYDKRFFIDLPVQYMKTISSEHVVYTNCFLFLFWHSEQHKYLCTQHVLPMFSPCSELAISMYWTCNSMNNLLSYCGLVGTRISASEKD